MAIRARDQAAAITVISGESDYFFSRTALMYVFMERMQMRDLEPFERGVYEQKRIRRMRGWVSDIDASTRRILLADGVSVTYDKLLIATGSVPNALPGVSGEGVVHFVSAQDLQKCIRLTPSTRQAVVIGGGLIGIELVECLAHHRVDVTFLVREKWYWPMALGEQEGQMVAAHIERHGVKVVFDEELAEIRAHGRVEAVNTNRGRQLPCQMLGIAIGVRPAIDWLRSCTTPPALGQGVLVGPDFRTSLDDVFSAGDCAEVAGVGVEQIWYSAKRQSELAARSMLGDTVQYVPPLFFNSAKMFDLEYTTVGRVPVGGENFYYREPKREISIRIAAEDQQVTGFNMIGSRWDHRKLAEWIEQRRSPAEVMAMLHQAQFDEEFGRFDLEPARRQFTREQQR